MPNAAEIIERMAAELEIYKLFAVARGFSDKDAVRKDVAALLQKSLADEDQSE